MLVYLENPHCMECGNEIVFADENQYYTVSEFACSKCGLVDNGNHLIFKCKRCGLEYRVREDSDGLEFRRVV